MVELKNIIDRAELVTVIVCAENNETKARAVQVFNKLGVNTLEGNKKACMTFYNAINNWVRWTLGWRNSDAEFKLYEFKGTRDVDANFERSCAWVQGMELEEFREHLRTLSDNF